MDNKQKEEKRKRGLLFWFVFLLAVSVIATSILTVMLMNKYYFDASGAIDISPNNPNAQQQPTDDEQSDNDNGNDGNIVPSATPRNPGFEASDYTQVWTTDTKVDIFRSTYFNKLGQMTVESIDSDKVIAPGTSNSFVFKISNTGNVPLDFAVDIDAYITPQGYELPVKARLHRYDNKWIVGDKDNWVFTPDFDKAYDSGTMGAGKYFYYTLDWEWPFESDYTYDTYLCNQAVGEDISLTIVIKTTAAESTDLNADMGITIPDTGDSSSLVLWGTVAAISLVACIGIIIFIILLKRDDDDEDEEENSAIEETKVEENKKE